MHSEYLQIRRHAIATILNSTTPIDPQSDLAAQHRTRKHNAIVIAGAITGILGNIDCNLAKQFMAALGIPSESAEKSIEIEDNFDLQHLPQHQRYRITKLKLMRAQLAELRTRISGCEEAFSNVSKKTEVDANKVPA